MKLGTPIIYVSMNYRYGHFAVEWFWRLTGSF